MSASGQPMDGVAAAVLSRIPQVGGLSDVRD